MTNKSKIERAKLRYENRSTTDDTTKDNNSEGAIEENFRQIDRKTPRKSLRSNRPEYDKNLCIICQKAGGKLHKVEFLQTGPKMLRVAKDLPDPSFFLRMNSIPNAADAVENDVKYHLNCWVLAQQSAVKCNVELMQEMNDIDRILADIEIVNIVNQQLNVIGDAVLDMKNINTTYNNLLTTSDNPQKFKCYLKQLLMNHIPNIIFTRPPARNEPERVLSHASHRSAVETFRNVPDNKTGIFEAAKIIRKDILNQDDWQFHGDFEGYKIPKCLETGLRK